MPYRFFIRRSTLQEDPGTTLGAGELAYTYPNNQLWVGHPDGEGNPAIAVGTTQVNLQSTVAEHEAKDNPHPQYLTVDAIAADVGAEPAGTTVKAIEAHLRATNPHSQYEAKGAAEVVLQRHITEANPHSQYLIEYPTPQQIGAETAGVALILLQQHLATNDPHQIKAIDADYEPEVNSIITGRNAQRAIDQLVVLVAQLQSQVASITPPSKPPLIVDPFVNADGKELKDHYPITYQSTGWIQAVGQFYIFGNRLRGNGTSQSRAYIDATASTGIAINAVIILRQVAQPQGVMLRVNASNGNHIRVVYTSNKFELIEVSTTASVKFAFAETLAFNQSYRFRVLLEDSKITLLVNNVQKISYSTTFNQTETRHGIYVSSSTTTQFEDFEVVQL